MGGSKTGDGANRPLMRPLMTTLAPKTLGKYQDGSKYWREMSVLVWQCGSAAEETFNKQK